MLVYPGADGLFTLYEDDGVTTAYEHGKFSRTVLRWHDAKRKFTATGNRRFKITFP